MSVPKIAARAAGALAASYAAQPIHEANPQVATYSDSLLAARERGIPDRLSSDKDSPFYDPQIAAQLDIIFEGSKRKGDVREYCIEDPETGRGWIKVEVKMPNGKPRIERGRFVTITKYGIVKPVWR